MEREKYFRECYVVAEDGADQSAIENSIKTMEDYFADYDTKVFFISERDMKERHSKMPHGGFVYHIGTTGDGNKHIIEYKLQLDSNPEYTGSVMLSYARAAYRMNRNGEKGAKTVLDVSPAMRSIMTREELLKSGWI